MKNEKKNQLVLAIILGGYFLVNVAGLANGAPLSPQDIRMKTLNGPFNITNPKGGYFIDNIPGDAELKANGSIKVGKVDGSLVASTTIGDIIIGEAVGDISATTQSGNITVNKASEHVSAQAVIGEVIIYSAKSVDVNSPFGGDVKLLDMTGYSKVVTRGNIELVLNKLNSLSQICHLSSSEGDITLRLPEDIGADIEIQIPLSEDPNRETRIESDFAFLKFKQRCFEKRILVLTTRFNNGGGKINLYLEKGNIYIRAIKGERR